jgi:hypothetical protein
MCRHRTVLLAISHPVRGPVNRSTSFSLSDSGRATKSKKKKFYWNLIDNHHQRRQRNRKTVWVHDGLDELCVYSNNTINALCVCVFVCVCLTAFGAASNAPLMKLQGFACLRILGRARRPWQVQVLQRQPSPMATANWSSDSRTGGTGVT